MCLGRHVVRLLASTRRRLRAGEHEHAVADRADRPLERPELAATFAWSSALPRYWRIPGAWPPARTSPSNASGSTSPHAIGAGTPAPARARGRTRSARRRRRACRRSRRSISCGSHAGAPPPRSVANTTSWPASRQQPPRHRDLGRVEVAVGQRHPDAHGPASPRSASRQLAQVADGEAEAREVGRALEGERAGEGGERGGGAPCGIPGRRRPRPPRRRPGTPAAPGARGRDVPRGRRRGPPARPSAAGASRRAGARSPARATPGEAPRRPRTARARRPGRRGRSPGDGDRIRRVDHRPLERVRAGHVLGHAAPDELGRMGLVLGAPLLVAHLGHRLRRAC